MAEDLVTSARQKRSDFDAIASTPTATKAGGSYFGFAFSKVSQVLTEMVRGLQSMFLAT